MNRPKDRAKDRAKYEIERLLALAKEKAPTDLELAHESVKLANKISQKMRIRLDPKTKQLFCKKCFSFFVPGKNCKVRVDKGRAAYECLNCSAITRRPYIKEQKGKRAAKGERAVL